MLRKWQIYITLLRQKLLELISERRQYLFPVANNTEIGLVEDMCLRVFIYGDDTLGLAAATQMLDGTRKGYSNIKVRADNFPGNPYLPVGSYPAIIAGRP